jgi:hypothetical protein
VSGTAARGGEKGRQAAKSPQREKEIGRRAAKNETRAAKCEWHSSERKRGGQAGGEEPAEREGDEEESG